MHKFQEGEWFLQRTGRQVCSICMDYIRAGDRVDWDHIHCEGLDGPHEVSNIRPLHHDCHKAKSAKDVHAIAKTKGTRAAKFSVNKVPIDQERPDKGKFGRRPFNARS